jgi:hypothetical protein
MIKFSRDPQNGDYIIDDTSKGTIETYADLDAWFSACLSILIEMNRQMDEGLARWAASYSRTVPAITETAATAA